MRDSEVFYSKGYKQGYADGYQAGIEDMRKGRCVETFENEVTSLPVDAMGISARARNCLRKAGCIYISDVLALDRARIARLRNMGSKSAQEIAQWLKSQDMPYNSLDVYL